MDSKGEESKISYPNIFFMIDSFEEVGPAPPRQACTRSGRRWARGWASAPGLSFRSCEMSSRVDRSDALRRGRSLVIVALSRP